MAIPTYDDIKLPLLKTLQKGTPLSIKELEQILAEEFQLTSEDRETLLPNGRTRRFADRVNWARTYLKQAGLIYFPERGLSQITPRGEEALSLNLDKITNDFLMQYPEFVRFIKGNRAEEKSSPDPIYNSLSPQEQIEENFKLINQDLSSTLLEEISKQSPAFFERLVVDLLLAMGYGGSREDAGEVVGKSNDGGIDGIIKEDKLGLDVIYIQAKRWKNSVGSPEINNFIGALHRKGASKGIFITSSDFTKEALVAAKESRTAIVLINGEKLTNLMIEYDIGTSVQVIYPLKKLDQDYFSEE